jgi:hypothetical protein
MQGSLHTEPQSQVEDILDNLRTHIDNKLRVPTYDNQTAFVPEPALRHFFDRDRIKTLLRHCHIQQHKGEAISNNYLVVFVILLHIGRGESIPWFLESTKHADARLPFEKLANLPDNCDLDFYERFDNVQWAFCAQELGTNIRTISNLTLGPLYQSRGASL